MPVKLEDLNNALPDSPALEHFLDGYTFKMGRLNSMESMYYVPQFINVIPHYESFSEDGVTLNCNVNPSAAFEAS